MTLLQFLRLKVNNVFKYKISYFLYLTVFKLHRLKFTFHWKVADISSIVTFIVHFQIFISIIVKLNIVRNNNISQRKQSIISKEEERKKERIIHYIIVYSF